MHESSQGSGVFSKLSCGTANAYITVAALWDSHFRVGGGEGTNLQQADCLTAQSVVNTKCMAASLLLHITRDASAYFENVWAWVADHDLDNPLNTDAYETTNEIRLPYTKLPLIHPLSAFPR